ncbi:unnamed protein product [Toxocara canis]|uniref:MSP domain-containing protein n=1 Tax=Toxocara canis TaxID=6265 RepID=A0A183UT71_TOXCA|nr:unnamed protein product [Toxocara canis]
MDASSSSHQQHGFAPGEFSEEESMQQFVQLINVDQTLICFDVDQVMDAKEELIISRVVGVDQPIAWRFRTNAPTRYIINPARGILINDKPVRVSIELVNNRFHPYHKVTLQAMVLPQGYDAKNVWKHKNASSLASVQTIRLRLSTMLMNIEYTEYIGQENEATNGNGLLRSVMAQSSTIGEDRIKELENLLNMLQADTLEIKSNIEQTIKLKAVLEKAFDARKTTQSELKARLAEDEKQVRKWKEELSKKEVELQCAQQSHRALCQQQQCNVS